MKTLTIRNISPAAVTAPSVSLAAAPKKPGREKDWVAAAENRTLADFRIASLRDAISGNAEKGILPNRLLGMMQKSLPIFLSTEEQMAIVAEGIKDGAQAFQAALVKAATPTGTKVVSLKEYAVNNPGPIVLDKDEVGAFLNNTCAAFRTLLGQADERVIAQKLEDAQTDKALAAQSAENDADGEDEKEADDNGDGE